MNAMERMQRRIFRDQQKQQRLLKSTANHGAMPEDAKNADAKNQIPYNILMNQTSQ